MMLPRYTMELMATITVARRTVPSVNLAWRVMGGGLSCGAGTHACWVETHLDPSRRDESRRCAQECPRHIVFGQAEACPTAPSTGVCPWCGGLRARDARRRLGPRGR